jgi:hypothetical protein
MKLDPKQCVLFSGGLKGTEAYFGALAERYGIEEVTFTFEGHPVERLRGLRVLTHEELRKGDVSLTYVSKLMNRRYPETDYFQRVLQTIWYQVNSAQEIFVVGTILPDATVKGGTGWGAEFAKLCNKPLYVFDQPRQQWFIWERDQWRPGEAVIRHPHFCGTGTRFLEEPGKRALEELFERSFERP